MIPDTMPVSSGWWVTRSGIERSILHEFSVALAWPSGSPRRQTHARHFAALAAHMSQQLPLVEQFSPQCVVGRVAPSPIPMLTFARHVPASCSAAPLGAAAPASSSIVAGSISATVSKSRAAHGCSYLSDTSHDRSRAPVCRPARHLRAAAAPSVPVRLTAGAPAPAAREQVWGTFSYMNIYESTVLGGAS